MRQRNGVCECVCVLGFNIFWPLVSSTNMFVHVSALDSPQRAAKLQPLKHSERASNPGGGSSTAGRPTWSAPAPAPAASSTAFASCWSHKKTKIKVVA